MDSKFFHEVESTYGENEKVVKLDCTGHVSKHMYRALEKLKKSTKGKLRDGKFIGGDAGRLTATAGGAISKLSDRYRNAIQTMKNSIMAILHHSGFLQQICEWC